MSHWMHNGRAWNPKYEDIDAAGFVYIITNLETGMKYVGRKVFHARRTLPPLKGKTRKRKVVKESDWRDYCGSSQELLADIEVQGKENFLFEIISFHTNRTELNYHELKLQILLDVLESRNKTGDRVFYNRNILNRYYPNSLDWPTRLILDEEYRNLHRNISEQILEN